MYQKPSNECVPHKPVKKNESKYATNTEQQTYLKGPVTYVWRRKRVLKFLKGVTVCLPKNSHAPKRSLSAFSHA